MDIAQLAKLGREAHQDTDQAEQMLVSSKETEQYAARWLKRAKYQDAVRKAADLALAHTGKSPE